MKSNFEIKINKEIRDYTESMRGGCGQILGPTMTGRKKNVVYGGREKESTSIV